MSSSIDKLFEAIARIRANDDVLDLVAQGDDDAEAQTAGGPVPSLNKFFADITAEGEGWLSEAEAAAIAAEADRLLAESARDDAEAIVYVADESLTPEVASIPRTDVDDKHIHPGWLLRDGSPDSTPLRADLGGAAFTDAPVDQIPVRDLTGGPATLTRDDEGMLVDVDDAVTLPRADYLENAWSTWVRNTAGAGVVVSGDGADTVDGGSVTIPAGQTWLFLRTGSSTFIAIHMGGGGLQSLPSAVMQYQGAWDASGGAYPADPETGDWYRVSVAGTVDSVTYDVGDAIVFNGGNPALATGWDRHRNTFSKADVGLGNVTNDAQLAKAQNLDDLPNKATARANLGAGEATRTDSVALTTRIEAAAEILQDGSIPQITEGDQIASLAYVPQHADSLIRVVAELPITKVVAGTGSPSGTFALFCDDLDVVNPNDAIGATPLPAVFSAYVHGMRIVGYVAAADLDTGNPTFSLRAGVTVTDPANYIEIGGNDGSDNPLFNGLTTVSLVVEEIPASSQV